MKKLLFRIKSAATAATDAFLRPEIMVTENFKVMADMYDCILKVQQGNRPVMYQIGFVLPSKENHIIATVWIGAGADSSPVKRIEQLCKENEALRLCLIPMNVNRIEQIQPFGNIDILISALEHIVKWGEAEEATWDDPGDCAQDALAEYRRSIKDVP